MTATTALEPAAESACTNTRPPCGASGGHSATIRASGTAAAALAATAPTGPGQPTSRCRTALIRATSAATTSPVPSHCIRSLSCPAARR